MSETTPGQAAYEAYRTRLFATTGAQLDPWEELGEHHREDWEAAAKAAIATTRSPVYRPEGGATQDVWRQLDEARAERDGLRTLATGMLDAVDGVYPDANCSGHCPARRIGESRHRWHETLVALTASANPTAQDYDKVAEILQLRHERDQLREALREALGHVEPVDQNSELAIARWQQLAEGAAASASPDAAAAGDGAT